MVVVAVVELGLAVVQLVAEGVAIALLFSADADEWFASPDTNWAN